MDFEAAEGLRLAPPIPPAAIAYPVARVDCDDPDRVSATTAAAVRLNDVRRGAGLDAKDARAGGVGSRTAARLSLPIALVGLIALSIIGAANAAAREPLYPG